MGGVDLWQNEDENYDNFDPQSMHDQVLEVVSISGTWHLGKLQVIILISSPLFTFFSEPAFVKINIRNFAYDTLFVDWMILLVSSI